MEAQPVPVILVHGLWMGGWAMSWLAHELREAGFAPHSLSYDSVRGGIDEHVGRLRAEVERDSRDGAEQVHLIGHSMGGVVVLRYLASGPSARKGRALLLGTPARGSQAALAFERQPWGPMMLGESRGLWQGAFESSVPDGAEVAAIAGDEPFGLGPMFVSLSAPSDGVVTIDETRLDGLRAHRVLNVSHTGMLLSRDVARQAVAFLRDGKFLP